MWVPHRSGRSESESLATAFAVGCEPLAANRKWALVTESPNTNRVNAFHAPAAHVAAWLAASPLHVSTRSAANRVGMGRGRVLTSCQS